MPIYEYRCRTCGARTSVFFLPPEQQPQPRCRRCGGQDLSRIMSRFATVRSEEDRLDSLADDPSMADVDENDPRSMARWMRRMGKEMGEDLGEDFDEAVDELESGREEEGEEGGSEAASEAASESGSS